MTTSGAQLQLDAGNTCLKWRLVSGTEILDSGRIDNKKNWQDELSAVVAITGSVTSAAISMVSGNARLARLQQILRDVASVEPVIARTQKNFAGVTVIYEKEKMLGVDRWLAMLAANKDIPEQIKVIVDCGTAMTIDVVDSGGQHLGGYIVPGLRLMKESLAIKTADLEEVEHPARAVKLGDTTMDCINHGVLAMSVAMVDEVCARYQNAVLYMTGGDAPQLREHLKNECRKLYVPDLVLDGLAIVSQHQK